MKELLDLLTEEVEAAFVACGYDGAYGRVTLSNRPDLCEFQCNGAMAAAKQAHCAPFLIADKVAQELLARDAERTPAVFAEVSSVKPGFLNLKIGGDYLVQYLNKMTEDDEIKNDGTKHGETKNVAGINADRQLCTVQCRTDGSSITADSGENPYAHACQVDSPVRVQHRYGSSPAAQPRRILIDYGGPNVAKPLHVGHLRSAIIGESIKRIARFMGHTVIGDVHLGDWGLQMGLIITELAERRPELPYFDENYTGEYPDEAPFTIAELEEIYPAASGRSKVDADYKARALQATYELQYGRRGYRALWRHIIDLSVSDLKRNYEKLDVSFDLWKGESDADPYIPGMVQKMKDDGFAYISDGALVVDVNEDTDAKEVPPCMILKSDGAALYNTTDLATMVWRMADYAPDELIYVVDKRQELYFTQVFRCAKKTGIVPPETKLTFLGFGTMNGRDGKPFKTREGGVMRLEYLIDAVNEEMLRKIRENENSKENMAFDPDAEQQTAQMIALSAIKYGDLSNLPAKDYIFDIDRFTSFEGNTGPYLLYTIVRIKSILTKHAAQQEENDYICSANILPPHSDSEKALMLVLSRFNMAVRTACEEYAPNRLCAYIYELANAFNGFYHETRILTEEDAATKASYLQLLVLTKGILETSISLLGFSAPDRM